MDVSECDQQVQVMLITVRMHDCNSVDFNQTSQSSVEITLNMSRGTINISFGTDLNATICSETLIEGKSLSVLQLSCFIRVKILSLYSL